MNSQARFVTVLVIGLLFLPPVFAQDETGTFSWPVSTPEAENVDPQMISTLVQSIQDGTYGQQKSLMILRHGKLIHEQYFNGNNKDTLMALSLIHI